MNNGPKFDMLAYTVRTMHIWVRYLLNMNLRYIKLDTPNIFGGEEHFRTQLFFSQTYGFGDISQ